MLIRIAARKSDLARLQAYRVGEALQRAHSEIDIRYLFSSSLGDQNQNDPLWKMPEKGVFTQDLTVKLIAGENDLVVHSWKDLPTEDSAETEIAATLPREDARDLILFRKATWANLQIGKPLRILSSSPRRAYSLNDFLAWALPIKMEFEFLNVRGNIGTRIEKLLAGEGDALVVAKAAIDRLAASHEEEFSGIRSIVDKARLQCRWMITPLAENPGAAAQGALAIEVVKGNKIIKSLLDKIHCSETFKAVSEERKILRQFGGGCQQKIGVTCLPRDYGTICYLRGQTASGEKLESVTRHNHAPEKVNVTTDKIFPVTMSESAFYERKGIFVDSTNLNNQDLYVARFDAWPDDYSQAEDQVVWTSGRRSWRKLAEKGVWVNGCHEGLGEDEEIPIENLINRPTRFVKLSHSETEDVSRYPVLKMYDLVDKVDFPDLSGKKYFYWASYTNFIRAYNKFPEIHAASHACGPGNTYKLIRSKLGSSATLEIFLSYQEWRKQFE